MEKVEKIYFIATYRDLKEDDHGWLDDGGSRRVVGFFFSFEEAEDVVLHNYGDLYEDGYYKYALIEGLEEGLYPFCADPVFYKWETDGYKKIERPAFTKKFAGLTIG